MKKSNILLILFSFLFACVTTPVRSNKQAPGHYCPDIDTTQVDFYDKKRRFIGSVVEEAPGITFGGLTCYESISAYARFVVFHGVAGRVKGNLCLYESGILQESVQDDDDPTWICP
jgi:hypothetical protein